MKIVAAYLLALLGGNGSPTEKDIAAILSSVGADAEDERIAFFLKSFHGRDVNEVIALGRQKFATLGGGGGGGGAVVVSSGGGGATAAAAEAPKEEEKKEEPKEESDDDMGFSLFD